MACSPAAQPSTSTCARIRSIPGSIQLHRNNGRFAYALWKKHHLLNCYSSRETLVHSRTSAALSAFHSNVRSSNSSVGYPLLSLSPAQESRVHNDWILRVSSEDFEIEETMDFEDDDKDDEEEEDIQDYETDYDVGGKIGEHDRYQEGDSFISTRGEVAESVVDYKINEGEFHKLSLQTCDFFIRKVPDVDGDLFDFREMYVTDPDTDIYAIPRADEKLPRKPVRLSVKKHEHFVTTELPVDAPRAPMVKNEFQVMKIFLMKHYRNRRANASNFVLDFDQIYVLDGKNRSISRAKVTLKLPRGEERNRLKEVLLVHDDGSTFSVIPESERKTADELVYERQWKKTKQEMDNYLRSFRDYPISNWF
ncbi:hypothetical protein KP509_38G052000 [Ceratopteris richardii]|uniref:Plastid transcriptionally active 6 n=1 Tax=Ceratopteris richardii TaxID=49495 RepID=A0A8T2Q4V8_CERRI|nr:hypothetical protein KP509_38G052000 [Ceratopteris richardii]KAH7278675.1 hypothetical protein KP509_38G052000 [Ceratopteris richardii]KAH7278676.1 hypothetical protein KP509_38G052000 [Ceratopteris richardii]